MLIVGLYHTAGWNPIFSHVYLLVRYASLKFWEYGSNAAIYNSFKPESNKSKFRLYFELFEKSCRGHHHSDILKTNIKTLIGYAPGIPGSASTEKWTKIVSEPAVCQDSQSESLESVKFREKLNLCLVSWWFYKNSHKLTMITRVSPTNCWSASSISSSNRKLVINTIPY